MVGEHEVTICKMLGLTLVSIATLIIPAFGSDNPASGNFNCKNYNPWKVYNESLKEGRAGCLTRLQTKREDYDMCRDPSTSATCYLFLQEPPFVAINGTLFAQAKNSTELQRPFKCGQYQEMFQELDGIGGIAMELHRLTSSREDYCMWAGDLKDCSFNQLVDWTEIMGQEGYRFAITGLLLELPRRQCNHFASTPLVDNSMVIIGKHTEKITTALDQLLRPFHWGSWLTFFFTLLLLLTVCLFMVIRFSYVRKKSLVTAFFIFVGDRGLAIEHEAKVHGDEAARETKLQTKYSFAMTLIRIGLISLLAIFAIFYEVSVVNFLFIDREVELPKRITKLSRKELAQYSILKDSALENVWNATVRGADRNLGPGLPWEENRCTTANECFDFVISGKASFVVSFDVVGKFMLQQNDRCAKLRLFSTKDRNVLYQFNGGWLYNNATDPVRRAEVDRELLGLRIDGTTGLLIDAELETFNACVKKPTNSIQPMVVLIPCLLFVGMPLGGAVLALTCWGKMSKRKTKTHGEPLQAKQSSSELEEVN